MQFYEELFNLFIVRVIQELLRTYVYAYFSFGLRVGYGI